VPSPPVTRQSETRSNVATSGCSVKLRAGILQRRSALHRCLHPCKQRPWLLTNGSPFVNSHGCIGVGFDGVRAQSLSLLLHNTLVHATNGELLRLGVPTPTCCSAWAARSPTEGRGPGLNAPNGVQRMREGPGPLLALRFTCKSRR
jgi:hypothetical protein